MTPVLTRIASEALDGMLHRAARNEDATKVATALSALRSVVWFGLLPPEALARIVAVAGMRLTGPQAPIVWRAALLLAAATRDPRLRSRVADIASGDVQPALSHREDLRLWVRQAAQMALDADTPWRTHASTVCSQPTVEGLSPVGWLGVAPGVPDAGRHPVSL
jgi:hypothetical protein